MASSVGKVQTSLDMRSLPMSQRHASVVAAFDRLPVGGVLEVSSDNDHKALRAELSARRPLEFLWDARNLGTQRWVIRIERVDASVEDLEHFLSRCAPFAEVQHSVITHVAQTVTERAYRAGETIFDEGEQWEFLGFVRTGRVVYTLLSRDGKMQTLLERFPGDAVNETPVFDGGATVYRCEAMADSTLVLIPREEVLRACRQDAELALAFLVASSQARRRSIGTIADLSFAHVLQRVAKWLLNYTGSGEGLTPGLLGVEKLSQAQIAAAAGTVRDMAARALIRLRDAGAVELERGRVKKLDRAILESFVNNIEGTAV
ncbi:MAG TPA: cyclic nucleotide-binding domain-containing protein [Candidatus Dormibacteraeota bacterium]|nr:cyclic nucleotide-binding domain-containing protein [Candidatus Dormibacteraeota bacterium]